VLDSKFAKWVANKPSRQPSSRYDDAKIGVDDIHRLWKESNAALMVFADVHFGSRSSGRLGGSFNCSS